MSDEIAFSSSGAPDLNASPRYSADSGDDGDSDAVTLPTFFDREGTSSIEREVSPSEYATAKEQAMRLDAIAGTSDGRVEQTAPKF